MMLLQIYSIVSLRNFLLVIFLNLFNRSMFLLSIFYSGFCQFAFSVQYGWRSLLLFSLIFFVPCGFLPPSINVRFSLTYIFFINCYLLVGPTLTNQGYFFVKIHFLFHLNLKSFAFVFPSYNLLFVSPSRYISFTSTCTSILFFIDFFNSFFKLFIYSVVDLSLESILLLY